MGSLPMGQQAGGGLPGLGVQLGSSEWATTASAGLASWLRISAHTAPQSPGSQQGGWVLKAGVQGRILGEPVLVRGHRSVRGHLGSRGGPWSEERQPVKLGLVTMGEGVTG